VPATGVHWLWKVQRQTACCFMAGKTQQAVGANGTVPPCSPCTRWSSLAARRSRCSRRACTAAVTVRVAAAPATPPACCAGPAAAATACCAPACLNPVQELLLVVFYPEADVVLLTVGLQLGSTPVLAGLLAGCAVGGAPATPRTSSSNQIEEVLLCVSVLEGEPSFCAVFLQFVLQPAHVGLHLASTTAADPGTNYCLYKQYIY
jgi:hypothetical protein